MYYGFYYVPRKNNIVQFRIFMCRNVFIVPNLF